MDPSPIFIIGFMAAGKTTVGQLVAEKLGRRFVDLDERIETAEGKTIAEMFEREGESGFRRREAAMLAQVGAEREVVIACGGGTPMYGTNLRTMQQAGLVASLLVSFDEVVRRAGAQDVVRPLLAEISSAQKIFGDREAIYRSASVCVETLDRAPEAIADELARRITDRLGDVSLNLGERSYPIHVAPIVLLGGLMRELCGDSRTVAIVTDENVARAGHAAAVRAALPDLQVTEIVIKPGEDHKTLATAGEVAAACVAAGLDRGSAIIAVGGGVVGDLAGFVASTLYRGIALVQVPTTLLAMIDSAIGGKTGVDLPAGKNLIGSFWQPRFVLADVTTLYSLPPRELRAAHGEVIKYALLDDPELFTLTERGTDTLVHDLITRCMRQKARVVAADERELTGARARLNLGHTVGHAIEAASWRTSAPLLHGEAVALGLCAASRISASLGLCAPALPQRVAAVLDRAGLDTNLTPWLSDEVIAFVGADKKRAGKKVRFVALEDVGRTRLVDLDPAELLGLMVRLSPT